MQNTEVLPAHVGIILDGNRRWAKENGQTTLDGHRQGLEVLKDVSFHAFDSGIEYLSAYIFSNENWQRAEEEVNYLMNLAIKAVEEYLEEYHERGIKVVMVGRRKGIRQKVIDAITRAEEKTRHNTQGTLALCFNYGGKEELVDAIKSMLIKSPNSDEVTTELIADNLYCPEIPDIDLVIRSSGEKRTSGFMLYRAAYAELLFTEKYWPDYTTQDFDLALAEYQQRNRRYGS